MNKQNNPYDLELNREDINPINIIIDNMEPNRTVLELGCASGRMTQYMSLNMGCKVDVVELDKELFDKAVRFAHDGFCGNLLEDEWAEYYKGRKYDYIVIADVLEHLTNPGFVISKAKELLADDGIMWISVPNIAHNDIILNLMNNQFIYTESGLLDRTHVHFFTYDELERLIKEYDMSLVFVDANYKATGTTELFMGKDLEWKANYNSLLERKDGEIYQYIVGVSKGKTIISTDNIYKNYNMQSEKYLRRIWVDYGEGFILFDSSVFPKNDEEINVDLSFPCNVEMLWIEVAFRQNYRIDDLSCLVDSTSRETTHIDGQRIGNSIFFEKGNRGIYWDKIYANTSVKIRGHISFNLEDNLIVKENETIKILKNKIKNLENEKADMEKEIFRFKHPIKSRFM